MVAESVRLIPPSEIERNPENPRLIFREDELQSLEDSIAKQGILVPLTVYEAAVGFVILDGERRWRCALKLNLPTVPAIVQSEPDLVTNIMMMFAIHKGRSDWDPLPTALKLGKLEKILTEKHGRPPKENELAAAASLSRGEIRRYRNILALPEQYKDMLLKELELPRAKQVLTVDHVLESTRAAEALWQRDIVDDEKHDALIDALIDKFRKGIIKSTVDPRLLVRIARAVDRDELDLKTAKKVSLKLISSQSYTIKQAFADSVERIDFEHGTEQLSTRTINRLEEHLSRDYELGDALRESLIELRRLISRILSSGRP